jgi:hypothetical protein
MSGTAPQSPTTVNTLSLLDKVSDAAKLSDAAAKRRKRLRRHRPRYWAAGFPSLLDGSGPANGSAGGGAAFGCAAFTLSALIQAMRSEITSARLGS